MELWIRSQDRQLLIPIKEIISQNSTCIFYGGNIIADYETQERAIEVLDEIQKILTPQLKTIKNKISERKINEFSREVLISPIIEDIKIQQFETFVYEMPKK